MSFIVASATVIVGSQLYQNKKNREAAREARRDQKQAEIQARKAEVFAETEGKGIGDIGTISLEVDDELDEQTTSVSI
jgi:hypothetical protein